MKFTVVPDTLRDKVAPPRRLRSPFTQALLDGKTIKIDKADRKKIGGNSKTLKNYGLRLRSGMLDDSNDEVLLWAEKIEADDQRDV